MSDFIGLKTTLNIFSKLNELQTSGIESALCMIISTKGSVPRKAGAKMIVQKNGVTFGTIGGGALEMQVIKDALKVIKTGTPEIFSHALVHDHGMCCGGTVDIYIEKVMSRKKLYIFGAGHIGKALAVFANALDFSVTLIDERPDVFNSWSEKDVSILNIAHREAFDRITFDANSLICVVTHNHAYDREIVAHCAKQRHGYLGMIGSKRKIEIASKNFRAGNMLTEEQMRQIDWPMGISIKTQTPEEIAISILAKLIDVRNSQKLL